MEKKESWKKAESGEVIKFDKEGDVIVGIFEGIEQSKKFKDSYALSLTIAEEIKVLFVSKIVKDLIERNKILQGMTMKITFTGDKISQNGQTYHTYQIEYK